MSVFDSIALVLSGGNALGAYQAGAYQALQEHGIEPDWVAAASAGAVNGALICGNPADRRLARLEEFWKPGPVGTGHPSGFWSSMAEEARRTAAANLTLAIGQPGVFAPRRLLDAFRGPFANREPGSIYDTAPLSATLELLVDFDLLNRSRPRFSVTMVDLESGEDVVFDTSQERITSEHVRASSALLPAFPPVEIGGRLLADAGVSVNLPLDVVLSRAPPGRMLCIAVDLLPLAGARPKTLGDATCRMQDLMFATQSRRALAAWQAIFDQRLAAQTARAGHNDEVPSITVLQIAYTDQGEEVSGKAFDFSAASARARWTAGHRDLDNALRQLQGGAVEAGKPGLTVYRPEPTTAGEAPVLRVSRESLAPAVARSGPPEG